jgi:hypothetical protein
VPDGDKGDITVSGSGTVWTIDNALNATKIADGSISNTEFQYLNNVSSNIQTQLDAKQALDATLTALAGLNTTAGVVVQTGTDTFTKRTLTQTANQVLISNPDGVLGNPTFFLPQNIHSAATPTFGGGTLTSTGNTLLTIAKTGSGYTSAGSGGGALNIVDNGTSMFQFYPNYVDNKATIVMGSPSRDGAFDFYNYRSLGGANTFDFLIKTKAAGAGFADRLTISGNAATGNITVSNANLIFGTDNSFDIGASGAFRPRNIYVAGSGIFGGATSIIDASVSETLKLGGGAIGWIGFYEGATRRGIIGYGDSGTILSNTNADSMVIRAENSLHLGAGGDGLALTVTTDRSLTIPELTATPSNPTSGSECRFYMKADKFVIQYNDAGTVRYKYLDLTGTSATWTHTTTAP